MGKHRCKKEEWGTKDKSERETKTGSTGFQPSNTPHRLGLCRHHAGLAAANLSAPPNPHPLAVIASTKHNGFICQNTGRVALEAQT